MSGLINRNVELKVKILFLFVVLFLILSGCTSQRELNLEDKKESISTASPEIIRIGYAISFTGPYSTGAKASVIPNYILWEKEVNEKGGIYLSDFNKQVPIKLIEYDDKSEIETVVRLVEKLILEDKVDLLLHPWGTAMNFAIAPLANKYKYPIICNTSASLKLREVALTNPYFFSMLNNPDDTMKEFVKFLVDQYRKGKIGNRVAVIFVGDFFGIEGAGVLAPELVMHGFKLVYFESYSLGSTDLSPLLKEVMGKHPDVFVSISYPEDTFLIVEQSKLLGFNPSIFYSAVGTAFPSFRDTFGAETVEGIMGHGVWNPNLPFKGGREYFEKHKAFFNREPDRWASAFGYASLQILEQAIEKVGSINREKIRDVIAENEFETIIGKVSFENQFNVQFPGFFGQWQNGEFEPIWPTDNPAAVSPIVPKPPWP